MSTGVYIGRFQPFHNGHLSVIRSALSKVDKLIVLVGSAYQARTVKNPWTVDERSEMIFRSLDAAERKRIVVGAIRDFPYDNFHWVKSVVKRVHQLTTECNHDITLIGNEKDESSFYLKMFPMWKLLQTGIKYDINATDIRHNVFSQDISYSSDVPDPVFNIIEEFVGSPYGKPPEFQRLHKEFHYLKNHHDLWRGAPIAPTFVTVDALVRSYHDNKILLIRRDDYLGSGLWALPSGRLEKNESIKDAAVRVLIEKTSITPIVNSQYPHPIAVFDHPGRSLLGRVVANVVRLRVDRSKQNIKIGDNVLDARWFDQDEINKLENEFFEDHIHIIRQLTSVQNPE